MNSKNRNTVDNIKSEVESIIERTNNVDKCRMQIWNLLDNKFQMKDIIDYRFGESDKPSREEIRERTLQIILDEEVDPLSSPLMNEFNITLQLPNMEFISLKVVKVL